jgi:ABC-2 type transport system ATP-binding protein
MNFLREKVRGTKGAGSRDSVVEAQGLHKSYGDNVAVDGVDLEVHRGELFGLLGPNGAGKTTAVECLQGLRRRSGGRVHVLGLDPDVQGDELRRRIGSQLQSSALPDRLRVGEALELFARTQDDTLPVSELVRRWGISDFIGRPFARLSGGQQQRLFIALALINRPQVVFFDELTTGLDPQARRATWELVRKVRDEGATVVLVTHFMEEAESLCDRVAIVDRGHIVATGTPSQLVATSGAPIRVSFTWPDAELRWLSHVSGIVEVSSANGRVEVRGDGSLAVRVAAALAQRDVFPNDFRTHYPNLEDVFLARTGRDLQN